MNYPSSKLLIDTLVILLADEKLCESKFLPFENITRHDDDESFFVDDADVLIDVPSHHFIGGKRSDDVTRQH